MHPILYPAAEELLRRKKQQKVDNATGGRYIFIHGTK